MPNHLLRVHILDFDDDITDRNLSWLTKMSFCSSGDATTVDSKVQKLL